MTVDGDAPRSRRQKPRQDIGQIFRTAVRAADQRGMPVEVQTAAHLLQQPASGIVDDWDVD